MSVSVIDGWIIIVKAFFSGLFNVVIGTAGIRDE